MFSAGWPLYARFISPTTIAFVNFQDFQYAAIMEVDTNPFIRIRRISLDETPSPDLKGCSAIYMFGMGLRLNDDQIQGINKAVSN